MEDAGREFQVFLAPSRDFYRSESSAPSKHRIVPVINKIFSSSSSSSSFTLNQRRSNVYKAVSGVSFQDTDVAGKNARKEKRSCDKKRERRQSCATGVDNERKKQGTLSGVTGARRSSSLTSVESDVSFSTDSSSKKMTEITHPFAPLFLYNQSSGRKSRYSRVKERRRSSSQARNVAAVDFRKSDGVYANSSYKNEQNFQPVRPRRTRSASRSCKPSTLASFSSENSLDMQLFEADKLFHLRCEREFNKNDKNTQQKETNLTENGDASLTEKQGTTNKLEAATSAGNIDFSVNDTDWRKYDALVTEKLGTLLKKKDEPEGGYFSLEREEVEELEKCVESGDHFQRDNCNESIYVAQVVTKDVKELPQFDQYTVEEIYSEVPFTNQRQEVGFVDDEGLYEEIFFDKSNEHINAISDQKDMGETSVNILVSPKQEVGESPLPTSLVISAPPKIEKSSSTTIVYIGSDYSKEDEPSFSPSAEEYQSIKQSASCNNLLSTSNMFRKNKDNNMSVIDIIDKSPSAIDRHRHGNLPWCGCHSMSIQAINHSSSCIQSRPGLLSTKCTLIGEIKDSDEPTNVKVLSTNEALTSQFSSTNMCPAPLGISQDKTTDSPSFAGIPEPDYELSDIDLDMFTPKTYTKAMNYRKNIRSISETHLNRLFRPVFTSPRTTVPHVGNSSMPEEGLVSPLTFRGFLEDSLFNPPDTESLGGDFEGLDIRDDQVITCITDSSSASSDESDETIDDESLTSVTSPWLEAQNEFEFVTFKEDATKMTKFGKRRKPRKGVLIPRLFDNPALARGDESLNDTGTFRTRKDATEAPKRPTRRRKTTEICKVKEAI